MIPVDVLEVLDALGLTDDFDRVSGLFRATLDENEYFFIPYSVNIYGLEGGLGAFFRDNDWESYMKYTLSTQGVPVQPL